MREYMINRLREVKDLSELPYEAVEALVDKMLANGHYIYQGNGFAFYIKCSDAALDNLKKDKSILYNTEKVRELLDGDGPNVHFIGLYGDRQGNGYISILRGLKELVKKERPSSISWFDKEMKRFILRRL